MSTDGPIAAPVVSTDPKKVIRDEFRALAKKIVIRLDSNPLKTMFNENRPSLTPKDLGFAVLEATENGNGELVTFFLKECGENEIDFEDLLRAFEIAILINNQKTLTPFHKHFTKGSSPRPQNHKKEHIDTLNALLIANGDTAKVYERELSLSSLKKALGIVAQAGNINRFQTILKSPRLTAESRVMAFEKAVAAKQAKIVEILLLAHKEDLLDLHLGHALEKIAENADFETLKVLYTHCKEQIPAESIGMSLEKITSNRTYDSKLLSFILNESASKIEARFIQIASRAAVLTGRMEAFLLLNPKNNSLPLINAVRAKQAQEVASLLVSNKDQYGAFEKSVCLEKAAINQDLPSLQALYTHCKEELDAESEAFALEVAIDVDNERYNPALFAFLAKESKNNIDAQTIDSILDFAVKRERVDAIRLMLSLHNTPDRRKKVLIAIEAKMNIFYDPFFSLGDRIKAVGGVRLFLAKFATDFHKTRPVAARFAGFAAKFMAALSKAWKNEKPQTVPIVSATTASSSSANLTEHKEALRFSVPSAAAATASEASVPPPLATKTRRNVGFNLK